MSNDPDRTEEEQEQARARRSDGNRAGGYQRFGGGTDAEPGRNVPCRTCRTEVEISGFVVTIAKLACSALSKRGEPPLHWSELTFCGPCGEAHKAAQLADAEATTYRIQGIIAEHNLSDRNLTRDERTFLVHEGCRDYVKALEERLNRPARGRRREADL